MEAAEPGKEAFDLPAVAGQIGFGAKTLSALVARRHVFAVARQTIARWLGKKAESLPPLSETLLPAAAGDVLELDELWSFAGSKVNARRGWIALCRQTRQVVAYFVGDRWAESARALRERIPPDHRGRATRSDWWLAYARVFPRRTHRSCGKGAGENLPRRALELHPASTPRTLRSQNALLFPSATGCTNSLCVCSSMSTTNSQSLTETHYLNAELFARGSLPCCG